MPQDSLERLIERLEHAAVTLRAGELPTDRAAALVEECARIAAEAGALLDECGGTIGRQLTRAQRDGGVLEPLDQALKTVLRQSGREC